MVSTAFHSRGVTLIELMITIAIIGLLLLVAAPFTGQWTISSQLQTAKGNLVQAHAHAKASALRGMGGQIAWDSNGGVFACKGSGTCNTGSADLLWKAKNPSGVEVGILKNIDGDTAVDFGDTAVEFDSRGRPIDQNHRAATYVVSKGGEDYEFPLP